ncbi:MAG TPA: monovalent cation/H+ antiporter complex subunit F [Vicinamibacteria bacterium]|nr:monovalent cation/H+ antiporter complex subunit F [Vicinamibacteria bacterium]
MRPFLLGVTVVLALATTLSLYRVVRGPTIFDRLTGLGLLGTKTIVLLLLMGALLGRIDAFVDISLSYGLISFVGSLALAKYFESKEAREP